MKMLSEKNPGEVITIEGFVDSLQEKQTKNQKAYVEMIVASNGKNARCYVWNRNLEQLAIQHQDVVSVTGTVNEYKGNKSLNTNKVVKIEKPSTELLENMLPALSDAEIATYKKELRTLVHKVQNEHYKAVLNAILKEYGEALCRTPAAAKVHEACLGGLLKHTIHVATICDKLADIYGNYVDRNLLLTAALIHDIGKIDTYTVDKFSIDYTIDGSLVNHIVIGYAILKQCVEKNNLNLTKEELILLNHCLLSHHGKKEWGSPIEPAIPEAQLLHQADMIDSRVGIMDSALSELEPGTISKSANFYLGTRVYRKEE
jgi:3'-5' exoribonuclease